MSIDDTDRGRQLVAAAKEGNLDILLQLLDQGADVNKQVNNTTALIAAAEKGHQGVVSLLLDQGADINKQASDSDRKSVV